VRCRLHPADRLDEHQIDPIPAGHQPLHSAGYGIREELEVPAVACALPSQVALRATADRLGIRPPFLATGSIWLSVAIAT
jgi:hypothetical protein